MSGERAECECCDDDVVVVVVVVVAVEGAVDVVLPIVMSTVLLNVPA